MKQSRQNIKMLLWFGSLVLGGLLFFFALYQPQQRTLQEEKFLLEEQRVQLISLKNFLNAHPDLTAYEKEVEAKEHKAAVMLPEHMQLSPFVSDMQKLAVRSNVALASIKPDKISSQGDYDELAVAVEATGDYFQLLDFLKAIENMPRFVRVRQMLMQAEEQQLHCRLLLVVYARSEKSGENL